MVFRNHQETHGCASLRVRKTLLSIAKDVPQHVSTAALNDDFRFLLPTTDCSVAKRAFDSAQAPVGSSTLFH
jgi:hypothetical protein